MRFRDGFLLQIILYSIVWFLSEYTGLLLCIIMAVIIASLLIFSLIIEMVEKSKVPKSFFQWLFLSIWPPIIVAVGFSIAYGGNFDWLNEFGQG